MNRHQRRKNLKVLQRGLDQTIASRPCGECSACCTALGVPDIGKEVGVTCQHVCASGCGIYEKRPGACKEYLCGWKYGIGEVNQRPDKLGIVMSPMPGTSPAHPGFIVHEMEPDAWDRYDVLVLMHHAAQSFVVVLIRNGAPSKILCPEPRAHSLRAFINGLRDEARSGASPTR